MHKQIHSTSSQQPSARETQNARGKSLGFGSCYHCGDSWYWKKNFDIRYDVGSGMFPLCHECFESLSFEAIIEYCQKCWDSWCISDPNTFPEDFPVMIIAASVKLEKAGKSQWADHPILGQRNFDIRRRISVPTER